MWIYTVKEIDMVIEMVDIIFSKIIECFFLILFPPLKNINIIHRIINKFCIYVLVQDLNIFLPPCLITLSPRLILSLISPFFSSSPKTRKKIVNKLWNKNNKTYEYNWQPLYLRRNGYAISVTNRIVCQQNGDST